ncbi:hypothetical protein SAMD00019534_051960, partial [Acytostelium subglobosum LB1]|uniref:hypothetical protein n=1 Tax=Acytostelium subglobosum LB1 TaxID=1410327 RepID=UPI000645066F
TQSTNMYMNNHTHILLLLTLAFMGMALGQTLKMAVLLPGVITDVSFNYMVNQGAGRSEQQLQISSSAILEMVNTYDEVYDNIVSSINNGYNYIITCDPSQASAAFDAAHRYASRRKVYFLIRTSGVHQDSNQYISSYDLNPISPFYMLGYIAGLSRNNIGLVVPGPPVENYYTANAFYSGVAAANANAVVNVVSTKSYNDPDTALGAVNILKGLSIDAITQSQYTMSVSQSFLKQGVAAFGSNGFPHESVLGDFVLQSIVTNYHVLFTQVGQSIKDQSFENTHHYLDFNNGFYTLDRFSFLVSPLIQSFNHPINQSLDRNVEVFGSKCITHADMLSMTELYDDVVDKGYYSVPTTEIYDRDRINKVFISVSSIQIFAGLVLMTMCIFLRNKLPVQYSNLLFIGGLMLGTLLVPIGVILFNTHQKTKGLCISRVWMISLGYTFLVGLMIIKNTRIYLKFNELLAKKSDKISPIMPQRVYNLYSGILLLNLLLLALYSGVGGPTNFNSLGLDGIGKYEFTQTCVNNQHGDNILYALLVFHGLQLLYGCVISWKTRVIDLEEFEETHEFATVTYLITFTLFIVIPLMAGVESQRSRDAIVSSMAIFTTFTAMLIIFGSKIWKIYKPTEDDGLPQLKMQRTRKNQTTISGGSQFMTAMNSGGSGGNSGTSGYSGGGSRGYSNSR